MHTFYQFFHLPHHKSEYLSILYLVLSLRTFVFSFLSLFLPILLLNQFEELGYQEDKAILLVGVIFLILSLTHGLLTLVVANINAQLGTKISLIIGQLLFLVFLVFISLSYELVVVLFDFILWGISTAFWWISYHTLFLEIGKRQEFGKQISVIEILRLIFGSIAPIFAGMVLNYYNKTVLYLIAGIIIALSIVLLLLERDFEKLDTVSLKDIKLEIKKRTRDFLAFVGAGGVEIIYSVVWPLLLYTIFRNYLKIGRFSSLVLFVTAIFIFIVGKLSDKFEKNKLVKFGAGITAITWLGKIIFQSPIVIFILDSIYRIFSSLFYLPLTALAYSHSIHERKAKYLVFREIGYKVGNLLGLVFFIVLIFLNIPFWFVFIYAASSAVLPTLIKEK
jgi:MFS family permease